MVRITRTTGTPWVRPRALASSWARHPGDEVLDRPDDLAPDRACRVLDQRVHAALDLPGLGDSRPDGNVTWVGAVVAGHECESGKTDHLPLWAAGAELLCSRRGSSAIHATC